MHCKETHFLHILIMSRYRCSIILKTKCQELLSAEFNVCGVIKVESTNQRTVSVQKFKDENDCADRIAATYV